MPDAPATVVNVSSSPIPREVWIAAGVALVWYFFAPPAKGWNFDRSEQSARELRDRITQHPFDRQGVMDKVSKLDRALDLDYKENGYDRQNLGDSLVEFELGIIANITTLAGVKNDVRVVRQLMNIDSVIAYYTAWRLSLGVILGAGQAGVDVLTNTYKLPYRQWRRFMRSLGYENGAFRPARRYIRRSALDNPTPVFSSYSTVEGRPDIRIPSYNLTDFINKIASAFKGWG